MGLVDEYVDGQADRQMDRQWAGGQVLECTSQSTQPSETAHLVPIHPALPLEVNLKCHNTNSVCLSERKTETKALALIPGAGT